MICAASVQVDPPPCTVSRFFENGAWAPHVAFAIYALQNRLQSARNFYVIKLPISYEVKIAQVEIFVGKSYSYLNAISNLFICKMSVTTIELRRGSNDTM